LRLFSLFPTYRQGGEKAPRHDGCGHDSAAARTTTSAALSFHDSFFDGRLRPAAMMFAARSRVKEEYFDQ
jgi:hypothetical protein